jgi:hypothetical protein
MEDCPTADRQTTFDTQTTFFDLSGTRPTIERKWIDHQKLGVVHNCLLTVLIVNKCSSAQYCKFDVGFLLLVIVLFDRRHCC